MEPEAVERLSRELAETRRHFDVVAEGVRADVRLVAEGVTSVRTELQQFRKEVAEEFTELRSMIRLSYAELDRRLRVMEEGLESLQARVERLEGVA